MTARVLIVDDEQNIRRMLRALLEQESYDVFDAADGPAAIAALDDVEPDVVLLDLMMPPGPDGLTTLEQIRARDPEIVVVMMSGKATLGDAVQATRLGAFQFLEKPLTPEGVLVTLGAARDLWSARAENRALRAVLGDNTPLVGTSAALERVRRAIDQVAPTPSRVLITGESGTGKELVAREIHRRSPRASRPMVSVNCAAIPRDLVESEMFGHERGAFTGATERRRGKFELAHQGTMFLDEIGDLHPEAQAKLLRALESGAVSRVGGDREVPADVRVIAATNQALTETGSFREDLYYRLNVFPISVPPLRKRREDIPLLVTHFGDRLARETGRPAPAFEPDAIDILRAHDWPGNVRELANVVERLAILTGGDPVGEALVGSVVGTAAPARPRPRPPVSDATAGAPRLPVAGLTAALTRYESGLIRAALAEAAGNIADAARRLGTDRANLYRRMRRLGVDPKDTSVSK